MNRASTRVIGVGISVAMAVTLAGCSSSGSGGGTTSGPVSQAAITKAMNTPTTITFWNWVPDLNPEIAAFEKKYPKIKVDMVDAGQGAAEYTKLEAAVKAGRGAPDVVQLEDAELPSFRVSNSLLNLAPYGAQKLKPLFTAGTWSAVSAQDAVYGVPQDAGPMTFMYRTDLLAKAGIHTAPATWAQFATDAAAVKAKTGAYLADFGPADAGEVMGMIQQLGGQPFTYSGGTKVGINLSSPQVKTVADFLTKELKSGDIAANPSFTNDWFQAFVKNEYAGWVVGAWGPDDLDGSAGSTSGKWTAAAMPQWTSGANSGGDWGGSSDAVMKSSSHPIVAYEFAKYLDSSPTSAAQLNSNPKTALFPATIGVLNSPTFTDQTSPFLNGEKANQVYASIAKTVDPKFEFPPFWTYATSTYSDTVGKAMTDHGNVYQGFQAWQKQLISYGKQQGFTVN